MAWPETARETSYVNGVIIPPASLNKIQDAIIDAHETKYRRFLAGLSEDWTTAGGWLLDSGNVIATPLNWQSVVANKQLVIPCPLDEDARVSKILVKVFNNAAGAIKAEAYVADLKFNASTTAPAGAIVGSAATATGGATTWEVLTITPAAAPQKILNEELLHVRFTLNNAGDRVAGVEVEYFPYTPQNP